MKKYILLTITLLATHQLFSADIEPDYTRSLPTELKALVISFAPGANLEEYIQNIKSLISTNKSLYGLLNDADSIQPLIREIGKQIGVSARVIAYCLNTPGAREWLKKQNKTDDPGEILGNIFIKETQDEFLNSAFINSKYFTQLAHQLGPEILHHLATRTDQLLEEVQNDPNIENFMSNSYIDFPDTHNTLKNFAILLVKFPDQQRTLINKYRLFPVIRRARHLLLNVVLPKLKNNSPFKEEIVQMLKKSPLDPYDSSKKSDLSLWGKIKRLF